VAWFSRGASGLQRLRHMPQSSILTNDISDLDCIYEDRSFDMPKGLSSYFFLPPACCQMRNAVRLHSRHFRVMEPSRC